MDRKITGLASFMNRLLFVLDEVRNPYCSVYLIEQLINFPSLFEGLNSSHAAQCTYTQE